MGRDKKYNRSELLDKAVALFWLKGFHATSTADLVEALGINRKSLYVEFSSKQGLFEAALEHYNTNYLNQIFSSFEGEKAAELGLDAIKAIFADLANAAEGDSYGIGCFLCNTASERASLDPEVGSHIDAYFERIEQNFSRILNDALKNKTLRSDLNIKNIAAFFTSSLLGVITSIRAKASVKQIWGTYQTISTMVDRLLVDEKN
ncbi:MAG: TetR/AcrR family transcriptional regulator [Spirochaetota bacterium]